MSQTTDEQTNTVSIVLEQQTENNFFTINSQKASEILGVNRTRLSQLTSQGIFPYERRKVDARSRLYYRLNDLLNYQRRSSFGNLHAAGNYNSNKNQIVPVPLCTSLNQPEEFKNANPECVLHAKKTETPKTIIKMQRAINVRSDRVLTKALDRKTHLESILKFENLQLGLKRLEEKYNKISESLSKLEYAILNLSKQYSHRCKSVPSSSPTKKIFKFIKR